MAGTLRIKHLWWWVLGIAILILIVSANTIVTLLTDFFWFKELSLSSVFVKTIIAKITCGLAAGAIAGLVMYINLLLAQRLTKTPFITSGAMVMQFAQTFAVAPLLRLLIPIASLFFAFMMGSWGAGLWETYLKFMSATPFGAVDQLFGKDIGFYVFALPFYRWVYFGCCTIGALSLVGIVAIYIMRQHIAFDGRRVIVSPAARAHVLVLAGLLVGSCYFFTQFTMYGMVTGIGHIVNGAGYADIKFYIPILKIMKYVSLIAAVLIWANIWMRTFKFAIAGVLIIALGGFLGKSASQAVQRFI
ncbi:MAG: UPF0182 family protein, partial [Chitinivibrionales bacterium]